MNKYNDIIFNSDCMKKVSKQLFLIILGSFLFLTTSLSQCGSDAFLDKCASNLGTFNYIKSFTSIANPRKRDNSEFSYVFSKGSTYLMLGCTENLHGGYMIISLYDRNHNLIVSTYSDKNKKNYSELLYPCSATGVYYIKATFQDAKTGCGMCILGFNKD